MARPLLLLLLLPFALLALGGCPKRPPRLVATLGSEVDCGDGLDEDQDQTTDCADSDCATTATCLPDLVAIGVLGLDPDALLTFPAGAALPLGAQVRNDGAPTAVGPPSPVVVRILASSSRLIEPGAVTLVERRLSAGLRSGEVGTLPPEPVLLDLPAGTYHLLLVVGLEGGGSEALATNNVLVAGRIELVELDEDSDGLPDREERSVARAFAPDLVFHPDERCAEFEGVWAVHPIKGGVSVFYGLAYDKDCGLPLGGGTAAHLGDAEFVAVDLLRDRDRGWEIVRVFLSAHFRSGDGKTALGRAILDHSAWMAAEELTLQAEDGGAHPQVIVARHKHAHYVSLRACRLTYDSCGEGRVARFEVRDGRNLGSAREPLLPTIERGDRSEWFWRGPMPFCGWQIPSLILAERRECAGVQNSWFEQLTAWEERRL